MTHESETPVNPAPTLRATVTSDHRETFVQLDYAPSVLTATGVGFVPRLLIIRSNVGAAGVAEAVIRVRSADYTDARRAATTQYRTWATGEPRGLPAYVGTMPEWVRGVVLAHRPDLDGLL